MKNSSSSARSGGIGFWGLLQIVFIVLKLTHVIDWPWVWVLAPAWIGSVLSLVVLIPLFVIWRKIKKHKREMEERLNGKE